MQTRVVLWLKASATERIMPRIQKKQERENWSQLITATHLQITGGSRNDKVIAYQIRQSFKPGEVTPEEANRLGHELAMRFTKGRYSFIVATHTDRAHIHNHIVFNATSIDGTKKFRNFWLSSIALQRVSDLVCLENGLSVIAPVPYSEREKRTEYPKRESIRTVI